VTNRCKPIPAGGGIGPNVARAGDCTRPSGRNPGDSPSPKLPLSPGLRRTGGNAHPPSSLWRTGRGNFPLREKRWCDCLPNLPKKIIHFNPSVAQGSFQCITIHLRMERKHNPSSIRVLHLDVASLAMAFQKTEPLQCGQHLPARQQRQLHIVNSTTSRSLFAVNSDGDGSKYKSMASGHSLAPPRGSCLATNSFSATGNARQSSHPHLLNDNFQVHKRNFVLRLQVFKQRVEKFWPCQRELPKPLKAGSKSGKSDGAATRCGLLSSGN